jgi:hypothetical protein
MNTRLYGNANPHDIDTGLRQAGIRVLEGIHQSLVERAGQRRKDGIRKSEKCAAAGTALKKAASNLNNYRILPEQDIMGRTAILQRAHIWALKRYVGITRWDV